MVTIGQVQEEVAATMEGVAQHLQVELVVLVTAVVSVVMSLMQLHRPLVVVQ
jgi:hypothetical protein